MSAIRRVAIVSCSLAASFLVCQDSHAQSRIIRSGNRVYRVVPSSTIRGRVATTVPTQIRTAPAAATSRSTSARVSGSSRVSGTRTSSASARRPSAQTTANRVLATKSAAAVNAENRKKLENADDDIPASAILTKRGLELSTQLKRLRYVESTLGSRHPSLAGVQEQILSIRQILLSSDDQYFGELPAKIEAPERELVIVSEAILDELSKDDLKQLVVRLATDVSKLRERLDELEEDQLPADES